MSPYQEVDHTADWALRVWATTRAALFADAANGMYALVGAKPSASATPQLRRIELQAQDYESLLVAWLQELLYYTESEGMAFGDFRFETLTPTLLLAEVSGRRSERLDKIIKAVTYHNLSIRQTDEGFEATIVFDV